MGAIHAVGHRGHHATLGDVSEAVLGGAMACVRTAEDRRNVEILRLLGDRFSQWVVENPQADDIPNGAHVVFRIVVPAAAPANVKKQVEVFNRWAMTLAETQRRPDAPLFVVAWQMTPIPASLPGELDDTIDSCPRGEYALVSA
jgi:hypothetical protein